MNISDTLSRIANTISDLARRIRQLEAVEIVSPDNHKLYVNLDGIAGAAITIIPGGTGDVTAVLYFHWVIELVTGGNVSSGTLQATPGGGAVDLYNAGGEQFTLTVAAGGDVTLVRAAGVDTARVVISLIWI